LRAAAKAPQVDMVSKVEDMIRNGVPVHLVVKDLAAEVQRLVTLVGNMA